MTVVRLGLALAAGTLELGAQCSQCFRSASAQTAAAREALNLGVLILLIPVFCILGGFFFLAWRRRNA